MKKPNCICLLMDLSGEYVLVATTVCAKYTKKLARLQIFKLQSKGVVMAEEFHQSAPTRVLHIVILRSCATYVLSRHNKTSLLVHYNNIGHSKMKKRNLCPAREGRLSSTGRMEGNI